MVRSYRQTRSECLEHPVRGKGPPFGVESQLPRATPRTSCPGPIPLAEGPAPRRSPQRTARPASSPPTANSTMANPIGDRRLVCSPNGRPERVSIACGPYFGSRLDGAQGRKLLLSAPVRQALVPSAVRIDQSSWKTFQRPESRFPTRQVSPSSRLIGPGQVVFELGSGKVVDF
jgi:hypothetical protein